MTLLLRPPREADLESLFEHQADPAVKAMAEHPGRNREAFFTHMRQTVLPGPGIFRVIEEDGVVVGNVVSWPSDERWWLGYVLAPSAWGRGVASWAVKTFLPLAPRPLFADVAVKNLASQRVLEKHGFRRVATHPEGVEYRLD
ncbi:MAG: GNAT family N-acetyltransferase [Myxococcota bacterium]